MTVQAGSSLTADLSITTALVYYLNRRRAIESRHVMKHSILSIYSTSPSLSSSNSIVNKLLAMTVMTGLLTRYAIFDYACDLRYGDFYVPKV